MNQTRNIFGFLIMLFLAVPILFGIIWAVGLTQAVVSQKTLSELPGEIIAEVPGLLDGMLLAAPPLPGHWNVGARVYLRGPLGQGFRLPPYARQIALVACGESALRLMPLLAQALATGCAVVLFADCSLPAIPSAVEILPLAALAENLDLHITLMTREPDPLESNCRYAQGGIVYPGSSDDPARLVEDIVRAGAGHSNPTAAAILAAEGRAAVDRILIERVGVAFDREDDGRPALALEGGIGIVHKNMSAEVQANEVDKVKRSESGMIVDPVTVRPETSIREVLDVMSRYKISGVPVMRPSSSVWTRHQRMSPNDIWISGLGIESSGLPPYSGMWNFTAGFDTVFGWRSITQPSLIVTW